MTDIQRTTVYFDDETRRRLDRVARHHRRNRSNLLAWLIDQEYARLFGAEDTATSDADAPGELAA